jgi:hypothetical protein
MATIRIDDETFARWNGEASAHGVSVEEWLKTTTGVAKPVDQSIEERLRRFDSITATIEQMGIGSGNQLDDSRETIYGDRGL